MLDARPDINAYLRVAYLRELHGDSDGAIETMLEAIEAARPTGETAAWAHYQLGNLYFNTGNLKEAEAQYEASLKAFAGYVHALAGLARIAAANGDYAEAIDLYDRVVTRQPVLEYVAALGDVYHAAGRDAEAQRQYGLVTAIESIYKTNGINTDLEMALFLADHPSAEGHIEEAVTQARAVYETQPGSIRANDVLSWALYQGRPLRGGVGVFAAGRAARDARPASPLPRRHDQLPTRQRRHSTRLPGAHARRQPALLGAPHARGNRRPSRVEGFGPPMMVLKTFPNLGNLYPADHVLFEGLRNLRRSARGRSGRRIVKSARWEQIQGGGSIFALLGVLLLVLITGLFVIPALSGDGSKSGDVTSAEATESARDKVIAFWEARVQTSPDDFIAQNQLALAYIQRARDTGDVMDYTRAQEAVDASLAAAAGGQPRRSDAPRVHSRSRGASSRLRLRPRAAQWYSMPATPSRRR